MDRPDRFDFPKSARLQRGADFERVFARRASVADHVLIVYGHENDLSHARLGLSVSRRVGSAVVRNCWKRLLREAFRLRRKRLPAIDLVVIPRPAAQPDWEAVIGSLDQLLRRLARKLARTASPPEAAVKNSQLPPESRE